jgi:hypothetical protein
VVLESSGCGVMEQRLSCERVTVVVLWSDGCGVRE